MRPREAQVFVDGHYAGLVDDFDGSFQSLRLESGGHKIEIHMPGFEDLELDVHVQPGRTLTFGAKSLDRDPRELGTTVPKVLGTVVSVYLAPREEVVNRQSQADDQETPR